MTYHTIKTPLSEFGKEVFVNWSHISSTTAIIFIHGFHGNAIKTWVEFPAYLTTDSRFKECDLYFYGYDSLRQQINYSAATFYQFIDAVAKNNHKMFNDSIGDTLGKQRKKINYSKILIVAHSMGAVVTRFAILTAIKKKATWLPKLEMVLFAPAHRGARVNKLWVDGLPPIINIIGNFIHFTIVTIDELDPDSHTLAELMSNSKKYLDTPNEIYITAKEVVAASRDNVVLTLDFLNDPSPSPLPGTHVSVCKPKQGYKQPLDLIAKHI